MHFSDDPKRLRIKAEALHVREDFEAFLRANDLDLPAPGQSLMPANFFPKRKAVLVHVLTRVKLP